MNQPEKYNKAVEAIKTAILQSQYEAAKGVNRIQLAVYFAIGKYISLNTRKGKWGTGALEAISQQLRKELPGLRGFAPSSMKNMRQFYEEWAMLDANSPIAIGELQQTNNQTDNKSPIEIGDLEGSNSSVTTDELQVVDNKIDIYHSLYIPDAIAFPAEDFFKVPFTHHSRILAGAKTLEARYYYIHRTAEENLSVEALQSLLKENGDYEKAFSWYSKAANQGYASAQFRLGRCYFHGTGVPKDQTKAFYWYSKAAEQGSAEAQTDLGDCYYYGEGTSKDLIKAAYWYSKAADQGDAGGQYSLGRCYENGEGITQDLEKASELYAKAKKQGLLGRFRF